MNEVPSPLEQVAAQAPPPTPAAPTSIGGLSPDITKQFMAQMKADRVQGQASLADRKSALETYQDAIKAAPAARTSADAFNAIGEGFYANPNFAWNPSAALASGFQRMNEVSDLRRQQAQMAPVEAAKVGYENYKDLSDKIGTKDLLTPAATISYLNQVNRTQGAGQRQNSQQYQKLFEINYQAAIKAGAPDALDRATQLTNQTFDQMQARPDAQVLRGTSGLPQAGAGVPPPPAQPSSGGVPPPPGNVLGQLPPSMRAAITRDMARNPGQGPVRVNIAPTPGAEPVVGEIPPLQAPAAPVVARGTPGNTTDEEAARQATIAGAKEARGTAANGLVTEGTKYYTDITKEAEAANATKNVLNKIDNNLTRLAANKQNGKFSDINKFISTLKVAWDPDGSKGMASPEDVSNAAAFEAADKENFQLGISSAKSLSSRATQMEFMRALTNNPNAMMTAKGREKIMEMLKNSADDVTSQQADLQDYMKKQGFDPTNPLANPDKLASLTGHRNAYAQYQAQRTAGRDIADRYAETGLAVPFKGPDGKEAKITVKPYWSNKFKALVAKYPDGIRKLNVQNTEE